MNEDDKLKFGIYSKFEAETAICVYQDLNDIKLVYSTDKLFKAQFEFLHYEFNKKLTSFFYKKDLKLFPIVFERNVNPFAACTYLCYTFHGKKTFDNCESFPKTHRVKKKQKKKYFI